MSTINWSETDINKAFRSKYVELGGLTCFSMGHSDFIPYVIEEKKIKLKDELYKAFIINENIKKIEYYVNKEVGMAWGVFLFEILLKSENYWISQYGDLIKIKRLPIKLVPIEGQLVYPHDMCALGVGVYKENINATVEIILTNELLDKGVMNEF